MVGVVTRPKKRIFLALILISLTLAILSTYGLWQVSSPGLATISLYLPYILGILLLTIACAITVSVIGIILAIMGMPTLTIFQRVAWSVIQLLFPVAIHLGKVFDIDKERVERSFIEVSNHLVRKKALKVAPHKLLILTPHCIQLESCPHKITRDINNCRQCGACQAGELLELARRTGVHLSIATGGTLARQVIKTIRPHAILAIACERDLTSGIQDVFPLPVIGVLNERPCGPCCNTRVDMKQVEAAINNFLHCEEDTWRHANLR